MPQHIRISQFITTYGPGAIIEGPRGPRVIPLPNRGIRELDPIKYEVSDQRMSQGLLGGARLFRLPSNAELGLPHDSYIYRTKPFPIWKLCLNIQQHGGNFYILYHEARCPKCRSKDRRGNRRNVEAIRFIQACPKGHMDEVDWYQLVHGDESGCQHNRWFIWYGGGRSLSEIRIKCPRCGSKVNFGEAYMQEWKCSGRFPEKELPLPDSPPTRYECDKGARIIQRQASNLRIPELVTLFTIPPRHTPLHNLLQMWEILISIVGRQPSSKDELERILINLAEKKLIRRDVVDEILRYPWQEIQQAIQDVLTPVKQSFHDLILEEFHALLKGSVNGIPPNRGIAPKSPVFIEMNPHHVRTFKGTGGTRFRVAPISRLRTVIVQRGYRRAVDTETHPELVDISFTDSQGRKWYPAVEFLGEGIFITIAEDDGENFRVEGKSADRWMKAYYSSLSYPEHLFRDAQNRVELHPLFVWWHTFSHLLIRAISVESGYSSAAIRERIYLEVLEQGARGGVVLYATQPGSEGTLGGLIALVPSFQHIINAALEQLQTCSGDPLCRDQKFDVGAYNGAACYGCLLLSETSCEHRNMWLDRNVMLENQP